MSKKVKIAYFTINKIKLLISILEFILAIVFMFFGFRIVGIILASSSGSLLALAFNKKRNYKQKLFEYNNYSF